MSSSAYDWFMAADAEAVIGHCRVQARPNLPMRAPPARGGSCGGRPPGSDTRSKGI